MGKTILTAIAILLVATLTLASGAVLIPQANATKCTVICVAKQCHNLQTHNPGCKPEAIPVP